MPLPPWLTWSRLETSAPASGSTVIGPDPVAAAIAAGKASVAMAAMAAGEDWNNDGAALGHVQRGAVVNSEGAVRPERPRG